MSEIDKLQTGAASVKDGLNGTVAATGNLGQSVDGLAQQFAALGSKGTAQTIASGKSQLSEAGEHLARAQKALDAFIATCEQAKGSGG